MHQWNNESGSDIDSESPFTLTNVLVVTCLWHLLFQCCFFLLKRAVSIPGFFVRSTNKEDDSKRLEKLLMYGPSYAVAGLHAIILTTRACLPFLYLRSAPAWFQLYRVSSLSQINYIDIGNNVTEGASLFKLYSESQLSVETSNLFFLGYLLYDIFHVLNSYPKLGGIDTIFHHTAFISASVINGTFRILHFSFCWLILGELSSIFLNCRWFLIYTGRGSTTWMHYCNVMFSISFFTTRILLYGWGILRLLSQRNMIITNLPAPRFYVLFVCALIIAGLFLNMVWMKSIVKIATKGNRKEKD